MTNAEKFVELVIDLYQLGEKESSKLSGNIPEIEHELEPYDWSDIQAKVQYYFARKNDKSRPRLSQILALLETDPNVQTFEKEPDYTGTGYKRPTTKIWSIMPTFDKLINILIDGGVLPQDNGEYHNIRTLVDPQTDLVILNPKQWLQWQVSDAEEARPDLFAKFPSCTWLEKLAIAIDNKLVVFKIRDWAKLAKGGK